MNEVIHYTKHSTDNTKFVYETADFQLSEWAGFDTCQGILNETDARCIWSTTTNYWVNLDEKWHRKGHRDELEYLLTSQGWLKVRDRRKYALTGASFMSGTRVIGSFEILNGCLVAELLNNNFDRATGWTLRQGDKTLTMAELMCLEGYLYQRGNPYLQNLWGKSREQVRRVEKMILEKLAIANKNRLMIRMEEEYLTDVIPVLKKYGYFKRVKMG